MKLLLLVLLCVMFIGCSFEQLVESNEQPINSTLPTRLEVVSSLTRIDLANGNHGYICVVKDNVTCNEFIVGRGYDGLSICPMVPSK
jgi:hypothetical protein